MKFKTISVITIVLACALCAFGQTAPATDNSLPPNFAAAGVSYLPGGSPAIAGTGLYARQASGNTYAFTVIDALPASVKPFTVTTQVSAGIAQKILTVNGIPIFVPTSAGVSYSGTNTGWAWSTGGLAIVPIKGSTWKALPSVRFVKSSVSNGSGYQVIAGVAIGWGW